MSKTKYVEYNGCGFWAYDVALSIFLKHLIDVALLRAAAPGYEWLTEAISSWRVAAAIPDLGLEISPDWTSAQIDVFTELTDQACRLLSSRERIDADEISKWQILDDVRIDPRGATEVNMAPIVELGRAVKALVQGELPAAPTGRAWCYGAPEGQMTI